MTDSEKLRPVDVNIVIFSQIKWEMIKNTINFGDETVRNYDQVIVCRNLLPIFSDGSVGVLIGVLIISEPIFSDGSQTVRN